MLIWAFARARKVMNEYWFAPLIFPDFTMGMTTVTFPHVYGAMYYDVLTVPSITPRLSLK